MKKWVNVKDSWLRYNKKIWEQRNSVTGGKIVKKYVFNDQLQFLKKNYIHNETLTQFHKDDIEHLYVEFKNESNSTTETGDVISEGDGDQTLDESVTDTYREVGKFNHKFGLYDMQPHCKKLKINNNWVSPTVYHSVDDRHMSFFRGILPSLKTLSEDEVLEFQVGVMHLLKGIKDVQKSPGEEKPFFNRCG